MRSLGAGPSLIQNAASHWVGPEGCATLESIVGGKVVNLLKIRKRTVRKHTLMVFEIESST